FGDRVWVESDTDGLANTGVITPVAGMVITATSGSAVYTTTTDAQGYYSFTVPAGTYTVVYGSVPSSYGSVVPSSTPGGSSESGNEGSYQQSGNPDQSHQNSTTVTVASGEANWTIDFAFNLAGTPTPVNLGNYVWFDQDGDGQQDVGEPGVGGVTVTLTLPNGNVLTTTTDASGYYTFTALTPNQTYTVTFFPPNGYTLTDADNGSDASDSDPGASGVVVVPMGSTDNYTIDAGLVLPVAQFGDRVWIESDTDGLASTGVITPVAGMVITATSGSAVYTTTTDAQGYYSFTVPAGTYTVIYGSVPSSYGSVVPSSTPGGNSESGNEGSYQQSGNPDQSHQNNTTVTVGPGEANWTIDFAFNLAGTPTPVNLGNYVWFDQDGDGQQDVSEPGVGGVTVTLTLPDSSILTTTTNASGYYTFTDLAPNQTYTVTFFPPEGYSLTDADNGDDASDSDPGASGVVVVPMGSTDNYTIDAGLVLPAQFGDRVWIESDTDGLASTGVITPVAGMVITATSGSAVYTTTTDAQGYYSFTVPAGTYTVVYGSVPSSYGDVVPSSTPGGSSESGNEGIHQEDGNPDQSHQNNTTVTVGAGEANWTIDFAFHVAGIAPPSALPEEEEPGWIRFLYLSAVQMGVQAEGAGLSVETGWAEERAPVVFEAAPEAVPAVELLSEDEAAVEMQEIETAAPECEGWRLRQGVRGLLKKEPPALAFGLFWVSVKGQQSSKIRRKKCE
ncbi:MAG: hypothetical protein KGS73_14185, partial [Chloroflexi bacterium]|nr:hypothetical protein [Chloroflexota bacterium]